jgi:ABC-2 type transport system ATP-binding protein
LRLDGVAKRYGIRAPWVVKDVSLEIPPGGLVRFEGRNGSGKSTILRVIAGVSEPGRGAVTGRPVTGYVPERFPPALPFPARIYLSHLGRVHGLTGDELAARIDACLDRLGGRELADVPLRHMSKGMCQKVAVAQALLPGTGLLVLDEAWTGLDAPAKAALDEAVAERLGDGGSVVYVDHEPARLAHLDADRWRLEDGRAVRVRGPGRSVRPAGEPGSSSGAAGSGGARSAAAGSGPAGPAPTVVIEVAGQVPDDVGNRPGVVSVRREGGRTVLRARAGASDEVLRGLLAGAGRGEGGRAGGASGGPVRVLRVDTEPAGPDQTAGAEGSP